MALTGSARTGRCNLQTVVAPSPKRLHRQCAQRRVRVQQAAVSDAPTSASGPSSTAATSGPGPAARQMYIQESLNFTGAELAARIPSMQAALRAQRAEAAAAASGGAVAGQRLPASRPAATSSMSSSPSPNSSSYSYGGGGPPPYAPPAPVPVPAARPFVTSPSSARPSFVPGAASVQVSEAATAAPTAQASTSSSITSADSSSSSSAPSSSGSSSSAPLPSASNLAGLSASEKLQALQQVQQVSRQAVAAAPGSSPYHINAPKTIDIRMYDQLVAAHNKLSRRLGETNAHIDVLEEQINTCNQDLMSAFELFKQIAMEFGTTSRLAQSTAAAVQFGVDPQDALDKIGKLQERLSTLEQAVLEQRKEFGLRIVRKVPVEWIGVASEVRVMGDFDDWTRGHELSAEDVTSDSVYARFEGTLLLRPGKYRVKFLVDNEWRMAADWPTEGEDNVLIVS